jgi:TolB-like protein/DNA-binding winged helix-turn-helix (wHTH) protein
VVVNAEVESRVLKFAEFEVDLKAGELRKFGVPQKLAGQPFEVLRVLLEHPQEVVTREEFQQRIWPKDTFVDYDLALRKAITRLREALGDSAENPRFIATVPRRGYRFIAPLSGSAEAVADSPPVQEQGWFSRSLKTGLALGFGAALMLLVPLVLLLDRSAHGRPATTPTPEIRSLAVLPLQNLSSDPAQEYFSEGMTDALITDLAQIASLRVISRTSVIPYKQVRKSLPEIARELNVDAIVEGTVQRSGDRVRITAQLIQASSDKHLWAHSYQRDMSDVFALERDLTQEIAGQIQAHLAAGEAAQLRPPGPVNPKTLEAYLQGNFYLIRARRCASDEDKRMAARYFEQAVDAEPNFAPAYIGLADSYADLLVESREDTAIREKAAERVLALNPDSAEAVATLAEIKWLDLDWAGAEQEYRRAVALNPNNADAREQLGDLLGATGRLDEGLKECEIAQALDPNADHLTPILPMRGENDRAIRELRRLAEILPDDGMVHYSLYRVYLGAGKQGEALQELATACHLFGLLETETNMRKRLAFSDYRGALLEWAKALEHRWAAREAFMPEDLAVAYTASGDKDRAFYWLEQAYQHRDNVGRDWGLQILKTDPLLSPLHSDPRFQNLLKRVGLPN